MVFWLLVHRVAVPLLLDKYYTSSREVTPAKEKIEKKLNFSYQLNWETGLTAAHPL